MAWGSKVTLGNLNTSLSETSNSDNDYISANHYSDWDTLNPGESAHIQVRCVFGSTGNDMYFRVVTTLDATSEVADNTAFIIGAIPYLVSGTIQRSIILTGPYKYRVEVRKGGTTAGSYTPNVYVRKNGISI